MALSKQSECVELGDNWERMPDKEEILAFFSSDPVCKANANVQSKIDKIETQLRSLQDSLDCIPLSKGSSLDDCFLSPLIQPCGEAQLTAHNTRRTRDNVSYSEANIPTAFHTKTKTSTLQVPQSSHISRKAESRSQIFFLHHSFSNDDVEDAVGSESAFHFTNSFNSMKRPTHPTPLPIFVSLPPISTSDFSRYPTTSSTTSLSDSFSSKTTTVYDFIGQVDEAAAAEHREPLTSQFSLLSKRAPAYSGPTTTISRHLQKSKSAGLQKSSSAQYRRSGSESSRFRKRAVSISHSLASPVPLDFQHVKLSPMLLDIQPAKESTPPTIFKRPVPRSLKRVAVSSTFPTQTAALHPGIPSYQAAERRPSAPAMMLSTSAGNFHRSLSSQSGMRKFSLDLAASPEHVPLKDDKGIILMDPNAAERVCLGLGSGSDKADKLLGINNETCRALPVRSVKKVPSWKIKSFGNFKSVLNNMTGVASKERKKVREEWERRQMNISHPIDVHRV